MRLGRLELTIHKKAFPSSLQAVTGSGGGWYPIVRDWFAGAWQRNQECRLEDVTAFPTVWACVSLIAADISKMWLNLVERQPNEPDGIWTVIENTAHSPFLRKPNHYQNRIKFFETWILSKLLRGNTYVLKARDASGIVRRGYILDATRVRPMVADDGSVFYALNVDNLSAPALRSLGIADSTTGLMVPAREIIHDIMTPLFHPLVGVSPIYAAGFAAMHGLAMQRQHRQLFQNGARPGIILTAPGTIDPETAKRIGEYWDQNWGGDNVGKVAVVGDGLKAEVVTMNAVDAQMIEQLRWTGETICSCFHVPPYKVGVGPPPTYNNIEALNMAYYTDCLQALIESLELCLDEGLELPNDLGTMFDLSSLIRMDTATKVETATKGIIGGLFTPNEGRAEFDLKPVQGGDTPYMQQQQFSLAALDRRDSQENPPPSEQPALAPPDVQQERGLWAASIFTKAMEQGMLNASR